MNGNGDGVKSFVTIYNFTEATKQLDLQTPVIATPSIATQTALPVFISIPILVVVIIFIAIATTVIRELYKLKKVCTYYLHNASHMYVIIHW